MADDNLQFARAIGEKLRSVRQRQDMSLRDLSARAGVSASMLSQIETGKAFPSVRSLYSIAAALEVPVDTFFPNQEGADLPAGGVNFGRSGDLTASEMREVRVGQASKSAEESAPAGPTGLPVIQPSMRPTIELAGGVSWARLTAHPEADAEFLEITYAPGATSGERMSRHNGREFGLILDGELEIELGFETLKLRTGDSIVFDSMTPHRLTNNTTTPMRALWVVLNQS